MGLWWLSRFPTPQTRGRSYVSSPKARHSPTWWVTTRSWSDPSGWRTHLQDQLRSRRDLTISDLVSVILGRDLRPESLELTINAALQEAAMEALVGLQEPRCLPLDPRTGAVLASVSSPSYDPESLLGGDTATVWESLLADPAGPLLRPGDEGDLPAGLDFQDGGYGGRPRYRNRSTGDGASRPPKSSSCRARSATISNAGGGVCNNGVIDHIAPGFHCLLQHHIRRPLDPGRRRGRRDHRRSARLQQATSRFPWTVPEAIYPVDLLAEDPAALAQSGIGERNVRAAPLHMAMVAAAIANDGTTLAPYLVNRIFDADGNTVETFKPSPLDQALEPATAAVVTESE